MEILEKTPTKLKLRYRPVELWILSGICALVVPVFWLILAFSQTWMFYIVWFPLIPIFFLATGVYSIISLGSVLTVELDKENGKIGLGKQLFFYKKITEHELRAIIDVEMAEKSRVFRSNFEGNRIASKAIVFVLRSGHALPLNLDNRADWREKQKIFTLIREFLGFSSK